MKKALSLEWQKFRFSKQILIAGSLIFLIFFIFSYLFWQDFQQKYWRWAGLSDTQDPWIFYVHHTASNLELIVGLYTLGFIFWQNYIEQNNGMWQRFLTVPVHKNHIIYSKLLIIYSVSLTVLLLFFNITLLVLKPMIVHKYDSIFSQKKYQEDSVIYFKWIFFYVFVYLKFITFHFWLTLKCREKYLLAFSIGFIGLMLKFINESPYGIHFETYYSLSEWIKITVGCIIFVLVFIFFSKKEFVKFFSN